MANHQFHIIRKRLPAFGVFLSNQVENIVKFLLRLLWRAANCMTTINRRNVGDKTPVIVTAADHMIVEKRLHGGNLVQERYRSKRKNSQ